MTGLLSTRLTDNRALLPYLLLFLVALGMRLWQLDLRAIHYDESLHAYYSWRVYQGQGYEHDPMMHGPFQFLATGAVYFLFGDSDFTARLLPAFIGSLAVLVPFFLRRWLGGTGSLLAALFLTFSPTFLYFSRFARNDIYIAFWTLFLLLCLWRYIAEGKDRYLYLSAGILSLSFATKENSLITAGIFLSFLFFYSAPELWRAIRRWELASLSRPASFFLLLFTLALPQFAAGISIFQGPLGITLANRDSALGYEGTPLGMGWWVAGVVLGLFLLTSAILGLSWQRRRWLISAGTFYAIYILLYTTFFTNIAGLGTGVWGSMSYWLVQHAKGRIQQPWFYYPNLLSIYEFLPLMLAIPAFFYYLGKRSPFSSFLVYWSILALILYSYAGEKTPWLSLHMGLPLILLASRFGGEMVERKGAWRAILLVFLLIAFVATIRFSWQASYQKGDKPVQMLVFAQSSYEVKELRDRVIKLAGEGRSVRVDSSLSWPWVWYLRDYSTAAYPDLSQYSPKKGEVLLVSPAHKEALSPYLKEYEEGKEFKQILWFSESYKRKGFLRLMRDWWRYFLFREAEPYWDTRGIAYFPQP